MDYSLKPFIRLAMYDQITKNFYIDRHIWDHEIIYIEKGKMIVTIEEETYTCVEGDIIFLRPNVHHILKYAGEVTIQPHVHFDFIKDELSEEIYVPLVKKDDMQVRELKWFREDYLKKMNINLPFVIKIKNSFNIKTLLYKLIDEFTFKNPYYEYMVQGLFIEMFTAILKEYYHQNRVSEKPYFKELSELSQVIYENVDKNLSLNDLASHIKLSKWHLIRVFKNYFDTTPLKYINQIRINRARELLQFSNYSIKEISIIMNFDNQQSFTRWFKQNDGKAPIKFRK